MFAKKPVLLIIAGFLAGCVNGLFGAGGGMILVPLLTVFPLLSQEELFPASVCIMAPVCIVSLSILALRGALPWAQAFPYLLGSAAGGILAGVWGKRIPVKWLHKALGLMVLWGGVRYLCQ